MPAAPAPFKITHPSGHSRGPRSQKPSLATPAHNNPESLQIEFLLVI